MKKKYLFLAAFSSALILLGCGFSDSNTELEKEKLKLEQEKLELQKEKDNREKQVVEEDKGSEVSPGYQRSKAKVTGQNVNIRSSHTVDSKAIGMLGYGEIVTVIGQHVPMGNAAEAILKEQTQFFDQSYRNYAFSLAKGKAVIVEGMEENGMYKISFVNDKTKLKSFARINAEKLEFIGGEVWKNIINSKGQSGWVLGRYIQSI
jgi:hypothetical protein